MKIGNLFINKQILEKKINKKSKINFSNFIESNEEDISNINNTETILKTLYNQDIKITDRKSKKACLFSKKLLEELDEIRDSIAEGDINIGKLKDISKSIKILDKTFLNQKILSIIEEIELRVEVELAKLDNR